MSTEPVPTLGAQSSSASSPVQTQFVWPHGGRQVFLCGSFTRWQDMIPMSLVDQGSTVFQVIFGVTPGYHQFKFVVDSEWIHDDQQPSVTDAAGNCSNYILVSEVEGGRGSGRPFGGSMDLEDSNVNIQKGLPIEGNINITAADLDASRTHIDNFLTSHSAYEVLLPDSGKVVALDITLPIKHAFHVLYEQGIPLAPLWDSDQQQFVGMLTASDFIAILMQIRSHQAILAEEELETHTIAAWKNEKVKLTDCPQRKRPLHYVGPDDSLKDVVRKLLHHHVSTVPVLHFPAEEASPQLLHLATLSGIVKCLCRHFQHSFGSLPLLNQPVGSLPFGTWRRDTLGCRFAVLSPNMSLSIALALLVQARVSSLPIIDENGSLLDIFARSDITALARDNTYSRVQLDHLTVEQALQLVHDRSALAGGAPVLRCQMCLSTDTLQYILEQLAVPGVRRVFCVEAGSRQIEGIITLSDVFQFLLV